MLPVSEPKIIADILDQTRKLTLIYAKRLEGKDFHKRFEIDGKVFNSVYWELAHVAWAESMLILGFLGDKEPSPAWLRQFSLGSNPDEVKEWPPVPELMETLARIHARSLEMLRTMDPELLEHPAEIKFTGWQTDIRHVLYHAIRHEGTHAGHLSWLCKLHDKKVI
jgi:uncharacterized damage-inducible protein DinB